jgi:hypothetical protein
MTGLGLLRPGDRRDRVCDPAKPRILALFVFLPTGAATPHLAFLSTSLIPLLTSRGYQRPRIVSLILISMPL